MTYLWLCIRCKADLFTSLVIAEGKLQSQEGTLEQQNMMLQFAFGDDKGNAEQ